MFDLEPIKARLADLQQPDDHPIRAPFEVADLAALVAEVERLRAERDGDGDVESGTLWHAQRDVSRLRNELHQIEALRRKAEIRCESLEAQIDAVDGLHRKTPVYDTFADDCEEHDPEEHAIEGLDSSVAGPSTVSSIDW